MHYVPPYGSHHHKNPHLVHADHHDYKENHQDQKEGHENSKHHLSEEDKGHKEHNSEKDHHSEQKDSGYLDKDKGRRKEGYRERGYKITAEREYFLNGKEFFIAFLRCWKIKNQVYPISYFCYSLNVVFIQTSQFGVKFVILRPRLKLQIYRVSYIYQDLKQIHLFTENNIDY